METIIKKTPVKESVHLLLAIVFTLLISALMIAFAALFMLSGRMTPGMENIILNIIRTISCIAGGFLIGKLNKKRGFLWGLLLGGIYFALLIIIRNLLGPEIQQGSMHTITSAIGCLAGGMLGGMIS